jgi:Ca2+-binding RTX toxin-like protein
MAVAHWGQDIAVNETNTGGQTDAVLAVLDGGNIITVWTDSSGALPVIRGQLFSASGGKIGSEFLVPSVANQGTGGLTQPSVTAIDGGGFVVSWTRNLSNTDHDIHVQRFDSAANPVGSVLTVINDSGLQDFAEITRLGSGFAIVAQDDRVQGNDTLIRRFDSNGVVVGADIIANTTAGGNYQTITELANGNFVVAWNNGGAARYRLYDSNGVALTGESVANPSPSGGEIAVTAYGNGGFIVSWMGSATFPTTYPSLGRLFDASGNAFGPLLYLSLSNTNAFNDTPELTVLNDGRVFATWFDGAGNYYGRVVDPLNGSTGPVIVINSDPATNFSSTDNNHLSIDTLPDGRIVAVWSGTESNGTLGIIMQILDPREGTITGTTAADTIYGSDIAADDMNGLTGADNLSGMGGNDVIRGGGGDDIINGNAGNDTLVGGLGNDTMVGGQDNDTYFVDSASDIIGEVAGGGSDRVFISVSYTLAAGVDVELMQTTDPTLTTAINLIGNAVSQTLVGNAGVNNLVGGGGNDVLRGLGGNDNYFVDSQSDVVDEIGGGGALDRVYTTTTYVLAADDNIEFLATTNNALTTAINLVGNALNQTIVGNAGSNVIYGGLGNDTLQGLGGADFFVFDTAAGPANIDTLDFTVADTIRMENAVYTGLVGTGVLTADQFTSNTTGLATSANQRIIYETDTGRLYYDSNGNAAGGAVAFAQLTAGLALTSADFVIV